jgi:hypothetical protein
MQVQNAIISGTQLGVHHTDHGILSFYISLEYDGAGQGFGGLVLDDANPEYKNGDHSAPTTLGSGLLLGIDNLFGCDWEHLKGKSCRVYGNHNGIKALGHYLSDKWLWMQPKDDDYAFAVTSFKEMEEETP